MADEEELFREEIQSDPSEYKDTAPDINDLKTSSLINQNIVGFLEEIEEDGALVRLNCTEEMVADQKGLIHSGFLFSSASYAALTAVNEKNAVIAVSKANFLSPLKLGDVVDFRARAFQNTGRKRVVEVIGTLRQNKVFEAEFSIVILDRHILSLDLG